jgi:hypothetical protein
MEMRLDYKRSLTLNTSLSRHCCKLN